MQKFIIVALVIGYQGFVIAQEEPPLKVTGFSYPDFGDSPSFKTFDISYPIDDRTYLDVRGFYMRNTITERFRLPIFIKRYITKKTYILGGTQLEWEFLPDGTPPPRVDIIFGAGHDFNKNISIEGSYQVPISNMNNVVPFGAIKPGGGFLRLGSKFKF